MPTLPASQRAGKPTRKHLTEGRRVCQFAHDGTLLRAIAVPLQSPTMPCFGSEDFKTLYITSAGHHSNAAERAAYPSTGQVLFMRVDVPGLPVNFFRDDQTAAT